MKKILLFGLIVVSVVGVAALAFVIYAHRRSVALSERPPRVSLPQSQPTAQVSSLEATLVIRYPALANILNEQVPVSQSFEGREHFKFDVTKKVEQQVKQKVGGDVGKVLGKVAKFVLKTVTVDQIDHISGDVKYHGAVSRSAPFQVAANGQSLRISVPLEIHGQAGINGDLAKLLALDKKNFDGAMNAWSDCTFGLRPDWSPEIVAKPDFEWARASIEIAEKVRISIKGVTEEPLRKQMQKLPDALMKKLDRETVRRAVEPLWKPYSVKLPLREAEAYLHLAPLEVALSDIAYTAEGLRFSLALRVHSLGSLQSTSPFPTTPLPDLTSGAGQSNRLQLDVPLLVDYSALASTASKILDGRAFPISTTVGAAEVRLKRIEIYPTGEGRIALGCSAEIAFVAKPSLSTKGVVYFVAEPYLDVAHQRLGVRNLAFRRLLDNHLWQLLSAVFEKDILEAVQSGATLDLAPKLAEAQKALQMAASAPQVQKYGTISIGNPKLGLGGMSLADHAFEVHALGEAELLLTLESIHIGP